MAQMTQEEFDAKTEEELLSLYHIYKRGYKAFFPKSIPEEYFFVAKRFQADASLYVEDKSYKRWDAFVEEVLSEDEKDFFHCSDLELGVERLKSTFLHHCKEVETRKSLETGKVFNETLPDYLKKEFPHLKFD